ncbi:cyanate transporter, partial [Pseudomonas syringae pv. tagetis]
SSEPPLHNEVTETHAMSAAQAAQLTTMTVFCHPHIAPKAPILARRFGRHRVVLVVLLTLAPGLGARRQIGEERLITGSML